MRGHYLIKKLVKKNHFLQKNMLRQEIDQYLPMHAKVTRELCVLVIFCFKRVE